jgi:pyruvate dehydrogenase E1 component
MKAVPDQIGRWVTQPFLPLGTDGFGRSDTRDALRRFFETDAPHVVVAVLSALAGQGRIGAHIVNDAIARYALETELADPRDPDRSEQAGQTLGSAASAPIRSASEVR